MNIRSLLQVAAQNEVTVELCDGELHVDGPGAAGFIVSQIQRRGEEIARFLASLVTEGCQTPGNIDFCFCHTSEGNRKQSGKEEIERRERDKRRTSSLIPSSTPVSIYSNPCDRSRSPETPEKNGLVSQQYPSHPRHRVTRSCQWLRSHFLHGVARNTVTALRHRLL